MINQRAENLRDNNESRIHKTLNQADSRFKERLDKHSNQVQ